MTKNTQGSEWEKRFDVAWRKTMASAGIMFANSNDMKQFVHSERQALLQKVREIINKNAYEDNDFGITTLAVDVDTLLLKIAKLEGEI